MSEESSPSRLRAKLMGARGEAVLQRAPDLQRHLNNTGVSSDTLLAGGNAALANLLTMDGCPTVNLGASQEEWEKELLEVGNFCRELMPVAKYLNAFSTCQSISQRTDDAALDDFKAAVARFMEDTPFHVAQQNGDGRLLVSYTYSLPIAKHLLEAEGVKEALAAAPNTLAWLAQTGVNSDIIKACIEAGAALTNDAPESDSALSAVFNNYTDPDFLKFVLSKAQPEHLNYLRPPTYWTIVETMIRNGNYDRALLLAEAGADIFAEGTWSALTETVTDMTFVSQFLSLDGVRKQIEPKLPCLIGYIAEKYNQCLSDEWIAALKNAGANVNETMEDCQKQGIDRPAVATFARFGYVAPLRKMIELGADVVNTKYDYGGNLLFHAAYDDMVDFLLNLGLDTKAKNSCGTTPALQALANFWAPAWRRLIPLADVSTVNGNQQTLLHLAAVCGIDATRQVLELEGSRSIVNAKDANGNTPLLVACSQGAYEVSLALLEVGAQVQVTANDGTSPLLAASLHPELVKLLNAHGAELNARDTSGRTALWKAASMASDIEVLKALLAAGARCDIPGESDESILAAYAGGDLPLDHHVYLRILDGSDRVDAQALLKLVRYCTRSDAFEPTYRELVKRGLITHNTADSDANVVGHFFRRTDNNEALIIALTGDLLQAAKQAGELDQVLTAVVGKDSVLHYAAYRGSDYSDPFNNHFKAMLTAAPHLVNAARSTDGRTPLHCAVGGNNKGAVQVLLELGANPSLRDANGQTAGDLASSNSDIASLLLESQP